MDGGEQQVSSGRLVFRFATGTAELAAQRLAAALGVLDQGRARSPEATGWPTPAPRHVLLGALCAAPAGLKRALARARPLAARTGRVAGRGLRLMARAPGADRLQARYDDARARALAQLYRWAAAGVQEEIAARSLARSALPGLFELAMARLADSPDLQGLLEEQSQGLTGAAVNRLRDGSRGADEAAQTLASRLLHRRSGRALRPALPRP